jgi:hypothetical protein
MASSLLATSSITFTGRLSLPPELAVRLLWTPSAGWLTTTTDHVGSLALNSLASIG